MKIFKISAIALVAVVSLYGCVKSVQTGFLSDNLVYNPSVFPAIKGRTTTSGPMQVDGSTVPFEVKLLALRSKHGKPMDALEKDYEIAIYKGNITQEDTTLEMISKKIGTGMYKPITINPIGGRIEVTPASNFIDTGSYIIDVEVSNIAGKKIKNNAAEIRINSAVNPFEVTRQTASSTPMNAETPTTSQSNYSVTIVRTPTAANRIIIRFVDKDGKTFNPASGQVLTRTNLPHFAKFDPYYQEVKTDTALVFEYPVKLPTFPLYTFFVGTANHQYVSYYRIPAAFNSLNQNINTDLGFRLWPAEGQPFVSGTFTVTARMNFATRK